MSIIHSIPPGSETLSPKVDLIMTFDNSTGEYSFDGTKYDLLELTPNKAYLIESITVGANITNSDFTTGRTSDILLDLYFDNRQSQRAKFFPTPFNVTSVEIPINTNKWFYSNSGDDILQILPTGSIKQQLDMIDLESVIITIRAEIYRAEDGEFIQKLKDEMNN